MKKAKIKYYDIIKKCQCKITSVIIFLMFVNMINLGVGISAKYEDGGFSVNLAESELAGIYNMTNLPIKIVNDLFKKDKTMSNTGKNDDKNKNNDTFALFVLIKQVKKLANVFVPFIPNFISGNKIFLKNNINITGIVRSNIFLSDFLVRNGIVKCFLLLLIIMAAFPRGIPVKINNFINIKFTFPIFIFNKYGIFHFITECKGALR
ncbi:MAG: hypothetical protein LBD46_00680 [Endomicrobium sp.]|jgi:hypothetical protein|nr:hypothetical protein [Endomicrobium sp.]